MSQEFIQFVFPCKDCLVQAICKDKDHMNSVTNLDKDKVMLGVPLFETGTPYFKGLMECWVNLGSTIIQSLSKDTIKNTLHTADGIPIPFAQMLLSLPYVLRYMINSTSWVDGQLYEFDEDILKRRIITLSKHMKGGIKNDGLSKMQKSKDSKD